MIINMVISDWWCSLHLHWWGLGTVHYAQITNHYSIPYFPSFFLLILYLHLLFLQLLTRLWQIRQRKMMTDRHKHCITGKFVGFL